MHTKWTSNPISIERPGHSPLLEIRLFGAFDVLVNGQPIPRLRTRKGYSLLALLVLRQGQEIRRDWLAETLWPDSGQTQALLNLRLCLTNLRKALGSEASRIQSPTARTLSIALTNAQVDTVLFDAALSQGDIDSLAALTTLYRGPFLESCYEEWAGQERQIRESAYLGALETLAADAFNNKKWNAASEYLRLVLSIQPSRETAQQRLMEALSAVGDYAAVTESFRRFRLYLHETLHSRPASETIAIYERVRKQSRASLQERSSTALSSLSTPAHERSMPYSLPRPLTNLIGREQEIEEIIGCMETSRLVTLTGSGGIGKTRLAIAVAEAVEDFYRDGICYVDLAHVNDPVSITSAVAAALGVVEEQNRPPITAIAELLDNKTLLLVLNNCEHFIENCITLVITLLEKCAELSILCTSRQILGVIGERIWRVPSLSLPAREEVPCFSQASLLRLRQFAAVQLFLERAIAASPTFQVTRHNYASIIKICRILDGIPLALELTAAWARAMSAEQIVVRLENHFALPGRSGYGKSSHQRTLEGAFDSSYALLNSQEKDLLRRLSTFVGGWTLKAAEAVCLFENSSPDEVLTLLTALLDKSLICYEDQEGHPRYRMLETARQYARARLNIEECARLADRHADYYLNLLNDPGRYADNDRLTEYSRIGNDHSNFLAALDWLVESGNPFKELNMATLLCKFWCAMGFLSEGRRRIQKALDNAEDAADDERARALNGAGSIAYSQGDYAAALRFQQDSLALYRRLDNNFGIAVVLCDVGVAAQQLNNFPTAQVSFSESHSRMLHIKSAWGISYTTHLMGQVALEQGHYAEASTLFEESLTLMRQTQNRDSMALCLASMGHLLYRQGYFTSAHAYFQESLSLRCELGDKHGILGSFEDFAFLAYAQGNKIYSARLFGNAEHLRETLTIPVQGIHRAEHKGVLAKLQSDLTETTFSAEWAKGYAMSMQEAVSFLLEKM